MSPQVLTTPTNQPVSGPRDVSGTESNYDLLKRVLSNTLYGDTSTNSNQNIRDYWEAENMEITENEGLTSSRQWETHQEIQTSGNLDEQQDMVDSDEEWPLVIKQEEEDSDLFAEDSEVTKLWKKVIADLSIEGLNSYKCRICSFESPLHV